MYQSCETNGKNVFWIWIWNSSVNIFKHNGGFSISFCSFVSPMMRPKFVIFFLFLFFEPLYLSLSPPPPSFRLGSNMTLFYAKKKMQHVTAADCWHLCNVNNVPDRLLIPELRTPSFASSFGKIKIFQFDKLLRDRSIHFRFFIVGFWIFLEPDRYGESSRKIFRFEKKKKPRKLKWRKRFVDQKSRSSWGFVRR